MDRMVGISSSSNRKKRQPAPSSGFLSRAQISEEFGLSLSFLAHLSPLALPQYEVGSKIYYDRVEVVAYIKSKRRAGVVRSAPRKVGRPRKPVIGKPVTSAAELHSPAQG